MKITDCAILHNGVKMPYLGLGVYKVEDGAEVEQAVKIAIANGYRSIDTAAIYRNERGVGKAIAETGVKREELFITTKVWNDQQGYESTLKAFEKSRERLNLDYIDLYLIHWAVPGKYKDTWKALEKLYADGHVRAIGVSNFQIHHLEDLMASCTVKPMVNQVELHPRLTQNELIAFCRKHDIRIEAWSPLMRGKIFDNPTIVKLSEKYNKTPAQIILRWNLQHEIITIPKSVTEHRIIENADLYDFSLTSEDMAAIDALNRNERIGADPDNFNF